MLAVAVEDTGERMAGLSVAGGARRPRANLAARRDVLIALAVFGVAFLVYNRTLTPGLSYSSPDGNELIVVSHQLGLAHPTGYPLYTWLGKLFTLLPVGDVAYRVNLLSAVLAAGSTALLYASGRLLGMSALVAAFAGLLFAFGRTLWSQAVIAEVYAPNAFMVALTLYWLLRWEQATAGAAAGSARARRYLFAFSLTYGLSLGTHLSNLGFAPAYIAFLLLVRGRRLWRRAEAGLALLGFLLGAAQFLWIPLRGADLLRTIPGPAPAATLALVYKYTLDAFSELRFAFPLAALPDRIVLYLELLRLNVTGAGIILGVVGMWALLFRATRRFYLLALMYAGKLFFFLQYRVFDLDVFFIPSHLVFTLFVGYGLQWTLAAAVAVAGVVGGWARRALALRRRRSQTRPEGQEGEAARCVADLTAAPATLPPARRPAGRLAWLPSAMLAAVLFLLLLGQCRANFAANDRSRETVVGDFYRHVYALLPPESVVWTAGAVFGYDMFYYRLAYGARPDISLPMLERQEGRAPAPARPGEKVFTTVRPGQLGRFLPPLPAPDEAWYTPTIAAPVAKSAPLGRKELVLYHVSATPPALAVKEAFTSDGPARRVGGVELVGYHVEPRTVKAGGIVDITYHWRVTRPGPTVVLTRLARDDSWLEAHELGFGNAGRYLEGRNLGAGIVIKEDYQLVIPSSTPRGNHTLQVGVAAGTVRPLGPYDGAAYLDLGLLEVRE